MSELQPYYTTMRYKRLFICPKLSSKEGEIQKLSFYFPTLANILLESLSSCYVRYTNLQNFFIAMQTYKH